MGKFSFIYTNSLDQAFDPNRALDTWADQLTADGRIYLEHTMAHTPFGGRGDGPLRRSADGRPLSPVRVGPR